MADRYWVGGNGTWNTTSTTNWSATSGGSAGASAPTSADNVFFNASSNVGTGIFSVIIGANVECRDITISGLDGAMTLNAGISTLSVYGSMTLPSTNLTWIQSGAITFVGTSTYGSSKTITTSGISFSSAVTFNSTTVTATPTDAIVLQDAFTTSSTLTLTAGTLNLNGYTLTGQTFASSNSNTRVIAFGTTGIINLTLQTSGTVWNTGTITGFSYTGTSDVRFIGTGSSATTFTPGSASAAQALNFSVTAGTYILSFTNGSNVNSLNFTGFSGSFSLAGTVTIYGDLTLSTTMTVTAVAQQLTFGGTSVTQTFTTNNRNIGCSVNINGSSNTVRLVGALTQTSTRGFTLTNGTLDINSQTTSVGVLTIVTGTKAITNGTLNATSVTHTSGAIAVTSTATIVTTGVYTFTAGSIDIGNSAVLSVGSFSSANANVRSIAYNTSGELRLTGNGAVWDTGTITNFSYTGTSNVRLTYASSASLTIVPGTASAAQAQNFYITAATGTLSISAGAVNILDFTGFVGTYTQSTASITVYGDLTFSSGMSTSTSSGVLTLGATSGTRTITTNGITLNIAMALNGAGATYVLADNFTMNSARNFTFTAGTLDINSKTTSLGILILTTGTKSYTNGNLNCASVTHTSGAISIGTGYNIVPTGTYTFTAGSITLNDGANLVVGAFSSSNSNTRSVAFGALGSFIQVTGSGATVWNLATSANFTYTGTPLVKLTYSGGVATSIASSLSAINFAITAGTYTFTITSGAIFNNLDFTGFSGTYAQGSSSITVLGNLTYSATMATTTTAGSGFITMTATSGTDTITTNGITVNNNIRFNGVGGTFRLADNFTQGTTSYFSIVNGTVDFNNVTYSLGVLEFQTGTNSYINYGGTLNPASVLQTSGTVTIGTGAVITTSGSYTLTSGTLTLNDDVDLVVGSFLSNNSNTRVINFGTSIINITGNNGTVCNIATTSGYAFTGSPVLTFSYSGSTGTRTINTGTGAVGSNAFNVLITAGSDTITFTASMTTYNVNFTGFSGTWSNVAFTIYGNLTLSSTMIVGAGTGTMSFAHSVGTRTITSNGETIDFPISLTGGGTLQLADTFTQGSTRAFGFTAGTLDLNSQTNSFGVFTVATGTHAIANGTVNAASVAHSSGNLTIGSSNNLVCAGVYVFTSGSITINDNIDLACGALTSLITTSRSIAFGTSGSITVNRSSGGSLFEMIGTNFSYTGSGRINISTTTTNATSIDLSAFTTEAPCLSFYITTGSYVFTINPTRTSADIKHLDFTGFSGTYEQSSIFHGLYGDLTFSPTMTSTTTSGSLVFINTTPSVIRSNGHTSGIRIAIRTQVSLGDAYTSNVSTGFTVVNGSVSNGNFSTNNYNLTLQSFSASGARTRTVNLGSSVVTITGSGSAWSVDSGTTVNAGTSTISMTSASGKIFAGLGKTYYKLNQGGSGALTVTGANTFNDITATTRPSTVTLPSSTTTTVSNFTLSGTSGNLVTLNSSTAGTAATLSKSSGTVTTNYLSIRDSTATGGATWRAPTNLGNVNVSNNTGWNFSAIAAVFNSNFFVFF